MASYNINIDTETDIMTVGFGEPSDNRQIVRDAAARLDEMIDLGLFGGRLLRITGPASMPVAFTIAHKVSHLFGAIAVFDPKIGEKGAYVVVITHSPEYPLGDLV